MSPRRRFYWGLRDRFPIIPGIIWLNLSKSGLSVSFHLGFATWNTRTGWYFHGPFGLYMRERRSGNTVGNRGGKTRREASGNTWRDVSRRPSGTHVRDSYRSGDEY